MQVFNVITNITDQFKISLRVRAIIVHIQKLCPVTHDSYSISQEHGLSRSSYTVKKTVAEEWTLIKNKYCILHFVFFFLIYFRISHVLFEKNLGWIACMLERTEHRGVFAFVMLKYFFKCCHSFLSFSRSYHERAGSHLKVFNVYVKTDL